MNRTTDFLRSVDLFSRLAATDLEVIDQHLRRRPVTAGEVLAQQGDVAGAMAIVASGTVDLTHAGPDGRERSVRTLRSGDTLGEVALVGGDPQSATATAVTDGELLVLSIEDFDKLVSSRPQLMRIMLAAISERAVESNRQLVTDTAAVAPRAANGVVYAVFSPRGGAGKTTLAVNLALRMAAVYPSRVALLDLDLQFDDAALYLGVRSDRSLADLSQDQLEQMGVPTLSPYLTEHDSGLRVVVGASRPQDGERVSAAHVRATLATLRRQFMVTIVDCDSSLNQPQLVALETATRALIVCTPELSTLRDVRECHRIFGQAVHLDSKRLFHCLNHPRPVTGLSRKQFEATLEQPIRAEIPHAGESDARTAASLGTVPRASGRSTFGQALDRLARDLQPAASQSSQLGGPSAAPGASTRRRGLARLLRPRR